MAQRTTSSSKFLDRHMGQSAPRPAAMADPVEGGPALSDLKARKEALKKGPFLNATPKKSTGPHSSVPSFPTKTATTRQAP